MKAIRADKVAADIERLLADLDRESERFREGGAKGLVREIRVACGSGRIDDSTVDHLSMWCHPARNAEREQSLGPLARKLSVALFGEVVPRLPGV